MTDRAVMHDLADAIVADHYERKSGIGAGHCVACRETWPCKPRQLASIYLDTSIDTKQETWLHRLSERASNG